MIQQLTDDSWQDPQMPGTLHRCQPGDADGDWFTFIEPNGAQYDVAAWTPEGAMQLARELVLAEGESWD